MAIDPNIALGYKPIQLEQRNPFQEYAQIAQIQNAQNQNALAQYQLSSAQRLDEQQNNLYAAAKRPDFKLDLQTAIQYGPAGIAALKTQNEAATAALTQTKTQGEIDEKNLKLRGDRLNFAYNSVGSAPTPEAAAQKIKEGLKDGFLDFNTATAELKQIQDLRTPEDFQKYRLDKLMGILKEKDKIEFMLPKIKQQDVNGSILGIQDNPTQPGYGRPIAGMDIKKTASVADQIAQQRANTAAQQLALDRQSVVYQPNAEGGVTAFPAKLGAGEIPRGRTAVAAGAGMLPFQGKPSEAEGKEQMSINQQRAIVKGAMEAVAQTPDAFGYMAGSMPESARARMAQPEENTNRSYLFNVVSGVIKERAGTAQSASEAQTLARFLPVETDNADIIKSKLEGFDKYLVDKEKGTTKKRPGSPSAANVVTNPQFPGFSIGKP